MTFLKVLNFDFTKIPAQRLSNILPKSENQSTSISQNGHFWSWYKCSKTISRKISLLQTMAAWLGISQCGNLVIFLPREINFGWFEKVKNFHFYYLWGFEFWFLEKFHTWKCQKFPKIQNSELFNWPIWQSLGLQNDQSWFNVKSEWQKKNPENSTLYIRLHWSVQYTKCRNSNIFLAFRFYVKSILEGLEMPFWQHLGIWIVLIW